MVIFSVKELVDSLGGFEWGSEMRTSDPSFVELLVEAKLKFGVSPFFEIELLSDGKLAVNNIVVLYGLGIYFKMCFLVKNNVINIIV